MSGVLSWFRLYRGKIELMYLNGGCGLSSNEVTIEVTIILLNIMYLIHDNI